ncbi:futalosine hydrolase [Pedobacter steynii]|uniref:Futalosine hydrolase n=1 Tax=Pedobacter steynii TaxID=430522 RepID=A0A1D7QDK8_9SPHI|nr:futalosine hydrolase [Pedobacter steynii]AOM76776.1 futalosine hydrolase [Pedobacter steynii]
MKILLVAATKAEIAILIEHFHLAEDEFMQTEAFDILITGVGMTATAFAMGKYLSASYQLVLNLGIAGSFDPGIPLGSVLNIVTDDFSELGAEDKGTFLPIENLGFGKSSFQALNNLLHPSLSGLPKVKGITVNTAHGTQQSIQEIRNRLNPVTESMEGAAVLYCCEKEGIACLQIRSISNYVEPRNKESWKIGLAIKNLNEWAIGFLTNS